MRFSSGNGLRCVRHRFGPVTDGPDTGTDRARGGDRSPLDPDSDTSARLFSDPDTVATLCGHFYRGEMSRMTVWRTRMDQTTNWAVIIVAGILTWAFSSTDNPHYILLVGWLAVGVFMIVEARRFRDYDTWRTRIRSLQRNVFARVFGSQARMDENWLKRLHHDLIYPSFQLSLLSSIGYRLQHVYLLLFTVILAAWLLRISVFEPEASLRESAAIGSLSGTVVVVIVLAVYLMLAGAAAYSAKQGRNREFEEEAEQPTEN